MSVDDEKEFLQKARQLGYRMRKPGEYTKITVYVHEHTATQFKQVAEDLDYRMLEAATEAFDMWIEAKQKDIQDLDKKRSDKKTKK